MESYFVHILNLELVVLKQDVQESYHKQTLLSLVAA